MKKPSASSVVLVNYGLLFAMLILIVATGFGMYFGREKLTEYALTANHAKIDAEINEINITQSKKLQTEMVKQRDNAARAADMVASAKSYTYQNQIVNDLNQYASYAGVTILGFNFAQTTGAKASAASAGGLKTVTAAVNLKSPMKYENLFNFLRLIENNLTKMQVSDIDITSDIQTPGFVDVPALTIEVFVK